jgi:HEAT repeat protein
MQPSRSAPTIFALFAALAVALPAPGYPQGARVASTAFARGKPLSEWIAQADHYVPELRREAIKAIASLGPAGQEALPVLIRATRDENEEVRYWAVDGLRRLGPAAREAAPSLLVVLSDDTRGVQLAARGAMEAIGPAAAAVLAPALRSPDPWLRANAAEALGVIGEAKGPAVADLMRLLADDSLWVRASAAWALGHLGKQARPAARPLATALQEELRRDPELREPSQQVRVVNLVYALGRLGKDAGKAVPLIVSVLHDGNDSLRSAAAEALAGIGGKAAQPLGLAVRTAPMPVRLEAARSLRLMGPQGKRAVSDLTRVLETSDELEGGHDLVIAAADALGAIGKPGKSALKALTRLRERSAAADVTAALDRAIRKIRDGA